MDGHKSIHFVCRGNTFRSRLAAARAHDLLPDIWGISSSGIDASAPVQTIKRYTADVAKHRGLEHGLRDRKLRTTEHGLDEADIIVFMSKSVYDEATQRFRFDPRKALVWDIPDIDKFARIHRLPCTTASEKYAVAEAIYRMIRLEVGTLCSELTKGWVDIVSPRNEPTGVRLPVGIANERGYWHRGVHILALTHDGHFVLEKRSKRIMFSPGMLDISLGGIVDSGETPAQAAVREIYEEIGVRISPSGLKKLFVERQVGYHRGSLKTSRVIAYAYLVRLPEGFGQFRRQEEEVAAIITVSGKDVRRLIVHHRLRRIGRLQTRYKFYHRLVNAALADERIHGAGKKRPKTVK